MRFRAVVVLAAVLAVAAFVRAGASPGGQAARDSVAPWQAGTCYRAYLDDERPPHVVKVLEATGTAWIRVEPQPVGPKIPGAREREPMWINTAELFAAQETPCSASIGR